MGLLIAYTIACKPSKSDKTKDNPEQASQIIDKVGTLFGPEEIRSSINYVDSAYRIHQLNGIGDQWKKYEYCQSMYDFVGDYKKAKLYIDSMHFILKGNEQAYPSEYANTLLTQGYYLHNTQHKYKDALKSFYSARNYALKNLDSCELDRFTYALAQIKKSQSQPKEAITYFKIALKENRDCKRKKSYEDQLNMPLNMLQEIGICYSQLGELDSTVSYYGQALSLVAQLESKYPEKNIGIDKAGLYSLIGTAYLQQKNYVQAKYYLIETIRLYEKQKGMRALVYLDPKIKLSMLYLKTAKPTEAKRLIDQVEIDIRSTWTKTFNPSKEDYYKLKSEYYQQTNKMDSAFTYLQKLKLLDDSVAKTNRSLNATDMEAVFKDVEQDYQLTLLEKNNEVKSAYLVMAGVLVLSVFVVVFGLLRNRKKLKSLNSRIVAQNVDLQHTMGSLMQSQDDNMRLMKTVAHDLRNPIAATISLTSLLLEDNVIDSENKEMLLLMKETNLHSLEMTDNLLSLNIDYGDLVMEPVKIRQLLDYCVRMLKFKADEKNIQLLLDMEEVTIIGNREKLWRLFGNLITNAIKFSSEGSVINIYSIKQPETIKISIEDHGIGIPVELQDKVFDVFTARREGTSGEPSFGLGLAISQQIVMAHNGEIWFESEEGKGTIFYVELPYS